MIISSEMSSKLCFVIMKFYDIQFKFNFNFILECESPLLFSLTFQKALFLNRLQPARDNLNISFRILKFELLFPSGNPFNYAIFIFFSSPFFNRNIHILLERKFQIYNLEIFHLEMEISIGY